MSPAPRTFGGLVAHDTVCLVEYRRERTGLRVLEQWIDRQRSASIDDALGRLLALMSARGIRRARLALAIEQFGVFHHEMTLPAAPDDVLRPIVQRETQRQFGIANPVVAFTRGAAQERRGSGQTESRNVPTQLFVAGAPPETVDALRARFAHEAIEVDVVTVVSKAIHSLCQATGASLEPTAVLVCLDGGPHLAFFLEGRLELAIDPPIALEGERAPIAVVLDQVERGAVYFRQQFRGASATRLLLSTRPEEYDALAQALQERLGTQVKPLFGGASSPEAVVAMGAVLEAGQRSPLDLYPHPPTLAQRATTLMRGANGVAAVAAAAAILVSIWSATQILTLAAARQEDARLRTELQADATRITPMRVAAERRADYATAISFAAGSRAERATLVNVLGTIADRSPAGVSFDSLRVSRSASGWTASLSGEATGATTAQAVRGLDAFYQTLRGQAGVTNATLDQLEYPEPAKADSARRGNAQVSIQFRTSFSIGRPSEGGR